MKVPNCYNENISSDTLIYAQGNYKYTNFISVPFIILTKKDIFHQESPVIHLCTR